MTYHSFSSQWGTEKCARKELPTKRDSGTLGCGRATTCEWPDTRLHSLLQRLHVLLLRLSSRKHYRYRPKRVSDGFTWFAWRKEVPNSGCRFHLSGWRTSVAMGLNRSRWVLASSVRVASAVSNEGDLTSWLVDLSFSRSNKIICPVSVFSEIGESSKRTFEMSLSFFRSVIHFKA